MQSRLLTIREQWILLGVAGAIVVGAAVLLWRGRAETAPVDRVALATATDTAEAPAPPRAAGAVTQSADIRPETTQTDRVANKPAPRIGVGVLGAVQEEGLYFFEPGERIQDLLDAAGGALPESDLTDINRTAHLIDETTLLVPELVEVEGQIYSYPNPTYNPPPYTRSTWYQFEEAPPGGPSSADAGSQNRGGGPAAPPESTGGPININTASQSQLETLPGIGPVTARKIIAHRDVQRFGTVADLEKVSGIGPAKMEAVRDLITVD